MPKLLSMPNESPTHRPVVLVHGFLDTGAVFRRLTSRLAAEGYTPHAINLRPNDGRIGLEALAGQLDAFANTRLAGQPFDLIGFSMGGLIARYYVQRLGGIERVGRLITLAAPHHGTVWSHLAPLPGLRQMRPGSPFINDLNRDAEVLRRVDFVSLWTPFDLLVFPARRAILANHPDIRIPTAAHPLMLSDPRVHDTLVRLLDTPR
ncbi:MAG: alpha/beta fold hydrolase [Rhodothermales bacterium]|nr:alpha/beta fold hydrolase [Rhodothermales bacterium]